MHIRPPIPRPTPLGFFYFRFLGYGYYENAVEYLHARHITSDFSLSFRFNIICKIIYSIDYLLYLIHDLVSVNSFIFLM